MSVLPNKRWRDPVPVSVPNTFNRIGPIKPPKVTGPRCKGCKTEAISEAYAPFCSSFCKRSVEACGK